MNVATTEAESARRRPRRASRNVVLGHHVFLLPMIAVLGLVSIYPAFYSIYMSFQDWNWGKTFNFVGVENFRNLLSSDVFWNAMVKTFYFTVAAVAVEMLLGLGLALVVSSLGRGSRLLRSLLLAPLMVSGIIVSVVWKVMLDPTLGVIPYFLKALHLPTSAFLGDPNWAMPSIVAIDTWWMTAFVFIVLYAGVQSLPPDLLEAAEVDGANVVQKLRFVMLPLLSPYLLTVALFRTIDCLKVFAIIFGTTGGGPVRATEAVQVLTYRTAFKELHMSEAMTIMVVFSVVILLVVFAFLQVARRTEIVT